MRVILVASLASFSLLRLSASTPAERADANTASQVHGMNAATARVGPQQYWIAGCRCRSTGGRRFVRVPGRWVWIGGETSATTSDAAGAGSGAVYHTSHYPPVDASHRGPKVEVSYPGSAPDETIRGIDWYLNGRGPFSN